MLLILYIFTPRWTYLEESEKSGMAVVEVDPHRAQSIQQQQLHWTPISLRRTTLYREARYHERKVSFYFTYLDQENTCLSFTIQRWYPVANMTRWLPVRVYDYYAPERFNETMFDVYNLFVLSICQVCGSYQCPYCPIFSWSSNVVANPVLLAVAICTLVFLSRKITFHH
ncbi:CD109 antigen [Caerostris extrusa]|uniref:CD109 antigen n=1 Tax=Caerostris extrusa TaxID=172846 RepID=A0AAV4P6G8_CAEEX|nr:CD109 antigen [Caerostris extrusa]